MRQMKIDPALITSLVERWRPETHSFHLPTTEETVTLKDVAVIWGLPISGRPVTGPSDDEWTNQLQNAFGFELPNEAFKNKLVKRVPGGPDKRRLSPYAIR